MSKRDLQAYICSSDGNTGKFCLNVLVNKWQNQQIHCFKCMEDIFHGYEISVKKLYRNTDIGTMTEKRGKIIVNP